MSDAMQDVDREIADTLRLVQALPRGRRMGRGRSIRRGRNHLRRMRVGQLVGERRRPMIENDHDLGKASLERLAAELERRGLLRSADQIRRNDSMANAAETSAMAAAVTPILHAAHNGRIDADQESEQLAAAVDQRVAEIAGDELESLPIETERETTALTASEVAEDLREVGAPVEALDAHDFASEVAGDDPQEGIVAGAETHPPTLEFPPVELDQSRSEEPEL